MVGSRRAPGRVRDVEELRGCPACVRVLRWAVLGGILLGVVLPFVPLVLWSFSQKWFFPALLPPETTARAWRYVLSPDSGVLSALGKSSAIALIVTAVDVALGVPAGRVLGTMRFRGKGLVEFFVLAPIIVPGLAVLMGIHVLFIRLSLTDTLIGVSLAHLLPTLPYMVLVMSGVFANYDPEYEEQALSLGASRLRTFVHVTFPAVLPGIVTGGLFVFLISWSQYILTVLIGGGRVITLPLLLFAFAGAGDNAVTAALGIVFLAPAVVILLATSRFLSGESAAMGGFGRL
jgi:putative spermidine/putrescine transport system permease protein